MNVVATAGHVDHGKSTLIRRLTGMDPDRLAVERERGLSIELGFAWTDLGASGTVAFVDVPGHERFITTMLAGIGQVGACLFVVAADDDWMPQAAEHLAALDALGVAHGVVAVTRCDLADPRPIMARARHEIDRTALAGAPMVPVSAVTGDGMDRLADELASMVATLPPPRRDADVRLWIDRRFVVKGAGTVVTGTLGAGRIDTGDELRTIDGAVRVRQIQTLNTTQASVEGPARVALNITGERARLHRGDVLFERDVWCPTRTVDVRIVRGDGRPPQRPMLHVGSGAVIVRLRRLDEHHARLDLPAEVPLRQGDRMLLRDPGDRRIWGLRVLDPDPPPLSRRGAGRAHAEVLARRTTEPNLDEEIEYRRLIDAPSLRRLGIAAPDGRTWFVAADRRRALSARLTDLVTEHDRRNPANPGIPTDVLARQLSLPSPTLVADLVAPPLSIAAGRVRSTAEVVLSESTRAALARLEEEFGGNPFAAPTANRLRELGLTPRDLGAAERAGRLFQPASGIVLRSDAVDRAIALLAGLPQPFSTSQARQRLQTSRRIAIPLLTYLDRRRITKRFDDDSRILLATESPAAAERLADDQQ